MTDKIDQRILKRYEIISKIGQGAYGHVWKAFDKKTSQRIALKKIYDGYRNNTDAQRTYREIMYSKKLAHPNLVRLHTFHTFQDTKDIYLNMEFVERDLQHVISDSMFKSLSQRYQVFSQMVTAIDYLHQGQLVHRDLKPANILVSQDWEVKLCDFGLIRSVHREEGTDELVMTENLATRWYRAPQILLGSDSYGKPVDVWSLGCIFCQMITGKVLFPGNHALQQIQKIIQLTGKPSKETIQKITHSEPTLVILSNICPTSKTELRKILNSDDPDLINLILGMLEFNPEKRLKMEQVKKHPFFDRIHCSKNPLKANYKLRKPVIIEFAFERLPTRKYKNILGLYSDHLEQFIDIEEIARNNTAQLPMDLKKKAPNPECMKTSTASFKELKTKQRFTSSLVSTSQLDVHPKTFGLKSTVEQSKSINRNDSKTQGRLFSGIHSQSSLTNYNKWYTEYKVKKLKNQTSQTIDNSISAKKPVKSPQKKLKEGLYRPYNTINKVSPQKALPFKNCKLNQVQETTSASLDIPAILTPIKSSPKTKIVSQSTVDKQTTKMMSFSKIKEIRSQNPSMNTNGPEQVNNQSKNKQQIFLEPTYNIMPSKQFIKRTSNKSHSDSWVK